MWNHQKGHMKEIPLAGGVLSLVGTFNPLELVGEERTLVFAVVDLLRTFERKQEQNTQPASTEPSDSDLSSTGVQNRAREDPTDG